MITIKNGNIKDDGKDIFDIKIENTAGKIVIKNRHIVCPLFYFTKVESGYILSTDHKLKESGKDAFSPVLNIKHSMWGAKENFQKMLNSEKPELPYKVIDNWSEICLSKNRELTVKNNDLSKLYSVDIEDSYPLIKAWAEKYSDIVSDLCRQKKFIPTLTGGCDTRILTYFWRNFNFENYRLRAVKKDGKNNVEKGKIEINIAEKVIKRLGMNLERLEEPPAETFSMCGTYTEATQKQILLNDKQFVRNVINTCDFEWYQVQPFVDDLYLMIKPHRIFEMRVLFMLLFCPDLLDIEIISEAGQGIYTFDYFKDVVDDMRRLIWKWKKNA